MAAWRVSGLDVLPEFRLQVRFVDGTTGLVNMEAFLRSPAVTGTVFEPLRDPAKFVLASCAEGAVSWPGGADLAPDAMPDAIRTNGVWNLG